MMDLLNDARNKIILLCIMLFFVFFLFQYWQQKWSKMNSSVETFAEPLNTSFQINLDPLDIKFTSLNRYIDTWANGSIKGQNDETWFVKNYNTGQPLKWEELAWTFRLPNQNESNADFENAKKQYVLQKNTDFSISFWLYLNNSTGSWGQIFGVGSFTDWTNERSPGVWLWCCNQAAIHIRHKAKDNHNSGIMEWTDEISKNKVPMQRPCYCTLVFQRRSYYFYMNGALMNTYQHTSHCLPVYEGSMMRIATPYLDPKSFLIKDFSIFEAPLNSNQVLILYEQNKTRGDINGARKALGTAEGFQGQQDKKETSTLIEPFDMYDILNPFSPKKEGFEDCSILPNELFSFYDQTLLSGNSIASANLDSAKSNSALPTTNISLPTIKNGPKGTKAIYLDKHQYNLPKSVYLYYYRFNPKSQHYMRINPGFSLNKNQGITFCMWFKMPQYWDGGGTWSRLIDFGKEYDPANTVIAVYGQDIICYTNYGWELTNFNGITNDLWYHLGWTVSANGTMKLYINGRLTKTAAKNVGSVSDQLDLKNLFIGRSNYEWDPFLNASLADLRGFNSELTNCQILNIYQNPKQLSF